MRTTCYLPLYNNLNFHNRKYKGWYWEMGESDTDESTRRPFGLTITVPFIAEASEYDNVQKWSNLQTFLIGLSPLIYESNVLWNIGYFIIYTRMISRSQWRLLKTSKFHRLHQPAQNLKWTRIFITLMKLPKCSSFSEVTSVWPYILTSPLLRHVGRLA